MNPPVSHSGATSMRTHMWVTSAPLISGQKFQCAAGSVDVESMVSISRLSISATTAVFSSV